TRNLCSDRAWRTSCTSRSAISSRGDSSDRENVRPSRWVGSACCTRCTPAGLLLAWTCTRASLREAIHVFATSVLGAHQEGHRMLLVPIQSVSWHRPLQSLESQKLPQAHRDGVSLALAPFDPRHPHSR